MTEIAAMLTGVSALIVAVGVLYLVFRISNVADAMSENMRKNNKD